MPASRSKARPDASREHSIQHNSYFGGRVQSLGFSADGEYATVGVIGAGQHRFTTEYSERTTIIAGRLEVRLAGTKWKTVRDGQSFEVDADKEFEVRAKVDVAYLCQFKGRSFPH